MGDKIRVENATENYKFGRVERFENLSKNKGFGQVLHVKNIHQNDKWGTKSGFQCEPKRENGSH